MSGGAAVVIGTDARRTMRLVWAAATDAGNVRAHNEDGFVALPGFYAVADGMGGHQAGEVASALALQASRAAVSTIPLPLDEVPAIVRSANDRVHQHALERGTFGMGTTLVGLVVADNGGSESLVVFNVGDSRAYRYVEDLGLEQLTHDHSVVQELIDVGELTEDDAAHHPERNVVTRAIGIDRTVAGDYLVVPESPAARLLLCSDGVSGQLSSDDLRSLLASAMSPAEVVERILQAVLDGPAPDNATAVVVDVERVDPTSCDDDVDSVTGPRRRSIVDTQPTGRLHALTRDLRPEADSEMPA